MQSTPDPQDLDFIQRAIQLAAEHMRAKDGGPFGALVVRENKIIAGGWNKVTSSNDPTAHAEITAIRAAAARLGTFVLGGCVFTPVASRVRCAWAAAYWARVERIVFAATRTDAAGRDSTTRNSTGNCHCPRPSASFPCNKFFVTKPSRSSRNGSGCREKSCIETVLVVRARMG